MCYVCVCVLETQKLTCVNMCATCVHNFLNMCVRVVYFWKKYGKFGPFVVFYTCFHTVLSPIFHFLVCNNCSRTGRWQWDDIQVKKTVKSPILGERINAWFFINFGPIKKVREIQRGHKVVWKLCILHVYTCV